MFFWFISEVEGGRTVVNIVLLANVFCTVTWWYEVEDDFLGIFGDEEDELLVIVDIWNARNGRANEDELILRVVAFVLLEEIRWIAIGNCEGIVCVSSVFFSLEILRDTAQRCIFRLIILFVDIDRSFSTNGVRFIDVLIEVCLSEEEFTSSVCGGVSAASLPFDWLSKPSSDVSKSDCNTGIVVVVQTSTFDSSATFDISGNCNKWENLFQ